MNKKILSTTTALSLSALLGVGALIGVVSGKNVVKANATPQSYNCSELILHDEAGWNFRTLWTDGYGFSSGYDIDDYAAFVADFYGTDKTSSWDKEGSVRSWKRYSNGFNLCAGGTSGSYTYIFPEWVEYFSIQAENNNESRSFNYLNNLTSAEQTSAGNGYKKTSNLYAKKDGGSWVGVGTSASTTEFDSTINIIAKTDASTQVGSGSVQVSKYANFDETFAVTGYTFVGWYKDASLTQPFSGMPLSATTLYAKMSNLPQLATPVLSKAADNTVTWSAVANATKYSVKINNNSPYDVATTDSLKIDPMMLAGTNTIFVTAIGDGVNYSNSNAGSTSYNVDDGFVLIGTFMGWENTNLTNGLRMSSNGDGGYSAVLTTTQAENVKAVYSASGAAIAWQNIKDNTVSNNPFADPSYDATVVSNNVHLPKAGTYTITIKQVEGQTNLCEYSSSVPSEAFVLTVGNNEYPMTYHGGESGNEFKATGVNLTSGSLIGYKRGGSAVSGLTAKVDGNNNIGYDKTADKLIAAINNASADVYVDVIANTVWSGQNATPGYHMLKNGNLVTMTENPNPVDDRYIEYYTAAIDFVADDEIRFIDVKSDNRPVVWDITNINAGDVDDKFVVSSGRIKATATVTAAIYMKLSGTLGDQVYFGPVSEEERAAKQFAHDFLTAINNVCDPQGVTTDTDDLADAWAGQVTAFGSLIKGAQDILKAATAGDSVKEIRDFIAQYTYVLTKYGKHFDASTRDFLNKGITPNPVAENHLLFTKDSATTIAMVTIIAVVGLTAIGSVVYLRVRKHQ